MATTTNSFVLSTAFDVRSVAKELPNLSIHANVSRAYWEKRDGGIVERSEKRQTIDTEWSRPHNNGVSLYFRRHNGFKDQEKYDRMARGFCIRQGTFCKYYTTTFDPHKDKLYNEDNTRTIDRYFDVPLILSFTPENDLYNRFGIQHQDETEVHMLMSLFLELNYESLRKNCIPPACDENEHNPVWYQRGYEDFRYHGYTSEQIFPKAGDLLKIEAFNMLYEVESFKSAAPEYEHRWRKYWWKLFLRSAMDNGKTVSPDVLNDPEQKNFINTLIGKQEAPSSIGGTPMLDANGNPVSYGFDKSCVVEELKKDVIFRPPEVPEEVENITCDPRFYACSDKFGKW